jgi:hypothetical protein
MQKPDLEEHVLDHVEGGLSVSTRELRELGRE